MSMYQGPYVSVWIRSSWATRVHRAPSRGTFPGAGLSVTQSLSRHSPWGWAQRSPSAEGPTGGAVCVEGRWDF